MTSRSTHHDPRFLFEVSRRLNRALDLDRLLDEVRELATGAVDAEVCSLLLWNEDRTRLEFQMAYSRITPEIRELALAPGEGMAGWISEFRIPTISNDVEADTRFRHQIDRQIGFHTRNLLGVPIFRGSTVIGVLELYNKRTPEGFTAGDVRLIEGLMDLIAVALDNALLVKVLRREKAENEALYRTSLVLNEKLELHEILETFLEHLREVVPYQAAGFWLLHEDTLELKSFAHRGYSGATVGKAGLKLGQGAIGWVANTGEPLVIPDVRLDSRYVDVRPETRSEAAVPIVSESKVIGAFALESDRLDAFRSSDLRILRVFANQAAISIQRAQFYRELKEKHRLESELRFAREIQKLFLPDDDLALPGYDLAGLNIPSRQMSGDFYDYIRITDSQLGLMIGDVSGKGAPAALIMASLRASLRAEIRNRYAIAEILSKVNYLLWESTEPERFATAVYGVLDQARRILTYSNAGHNPPLLFRADGSVDRLAAGGVLLGPFPNSRYDEGRVYLRAGDILVLFTDGVTEAVSPGGEEFGTDRLSAIIAESPQRPAAELCRRIAAAVERHTERAAPGDDLTLLILRVLLA